MSDLPPLTRLRPDAFPFRFRELPREIQLQIIKILARRDPCNGLLQLCDTNPKLCPEEVFYMACSYFRYNTRTIRDAFLSTRPINYPRRDQRWYVCFRELCARHQIEDSEFYDVLYKTCAKENFTHFWFGHIS